MQNRAKKLWLSILSFALIAVMSGCSFFDDYYKDNQNAGNGALGGITSHTTTRSLETSLFDDDAYNDALNTDRFINGSLSTRYSTSSLNVKSNGTRRIIVELKAESQLDKYLNNTAINSKYKDFTAYINANEGKNQANLITNEHGKFLSALKNSVSNYEIRHSYTSIINAVSLEVADADVEKIAQISGVKSIIYSEVYEVPTVEATVNTVNVFGTGIYDSSSVKYKGDGMLVAVLDTGFDLAHSAFSTMPEVEKVAYSDVEAVFDELLAKSYGDTVTAKDLYKNAKVPFAYDYADGDADVFAKSNSHGVHVAGIIAGQDDTVTEADGEAFANGEKFTGVAPNAQLFIGKVFSDTDNGLDSGAETDDILAALADCVTVGVDVINMSLGSSCGFSRAEDGSAVNEIYDKIYDAGINLVVAASNSYSSALNSAYGSTNLTSNPDSSTVGSPSTYASALSVASISGVKSSYMQLDDGTAVYFSESSNSAGQKGDFMAELLGDSDSKTFNYVVVPGYGKTNNYTASVQEELEKGNCIAVVSRGDISFEDKQKNAFDNGAVGCIIYNNVSGKISASLGTGKKLPTCTVTADIGQKLVTAGKGTITLDKTFKAGPFMSDFSSWGPTNDLKIKPEITAHGGEITSSVVGGYDQYSGTSMASPNMAGAVTLLRQYVAETYGLSGNSLSDRVNQLLMSTATIINDEKGLPYSVRKQGAGLGDISKAMSTKAYLYVKNNSKTKLELGDDPDKTGVYTMEFCLSNVSDVAKTYSLDVITMTESVSIDNITVAEVAYMLNNCQKYYTVNGKASNGKVTVGAGEEATIKVTLSLTKQEKAYLDANFENGMYVEGFVTLADLSSDGIDLSIPYLAFYGDWTDAPIFDSTAYEVSADYYDTSIKDEDKTIATVYETIAIGRYYRGVDYYLPLGQYIYNTPDDTDSGVVSSVDKIAIGNSDYGIYEFYAIYFGMLRSASEMTVNIRNDITGEIIKSETQYNIRKAYGGTPTFSLLELSPYDLGMKNNDKYTLEFVATLDYPNGEVKTEKQEFSFYVDYQAPTIYSAVVRYEGSAGEDRKAYLDLQVYDNHYVQSVQLFAVASASDVDWVTDYPVPVTSDVRDGISKVTIDITDYLSNFENAYSYYANTIGVRVDDYALNGTAYVISLNSTIVDAITVNYTVKEGSTEVVNSLAGQTIAMKPGEAVNLSNESGYVYTENGNVKATFSIDMIGYVSYICNNPDAHGVACGYAYNERVGLTYSKGDWYYDAETGTVLQKTEDDEEATYPANTQFKDVIAGEVIRVNSKNYKKPESKHFVCPSCGKEVEFSFSTRTGVVTPKSFDRKYQEPMVEDAIWSSSNENVVIVEAGKLYAVGEGTATITAYTTATTNYNTFNFTVKVEGATQVNYLEGVTVGKYYDRNSGVYRYTSDGYASVDCGSILDLYPSFEPWYIDEVENLTWTSSNEDIAKIVSSSYKTAQVECKQPGVVYIYMSASMGGMSVIGTFTLVIDEEYTLYSYYFYEYNGVGYSETYEDATGASRKMLVIPANLGIVNMGFYSDSRNGPFYGNKNLDTVVVPEGVTTIGLYCFANSTIKKLYLPSSLESIAAGAFHSCSIEEIYWYNASEKSGTKIEYDAENNTYNWDEFYKEVTTECTAKRLAIGSNAFTYCTSLKDFDFSKVTALYGNAFSYCTKIEKADLSALRFIGTGVFSNCSNLSEVILTENTAINSYMFKGTAVEKIDYYASDIPSYTFYGATSLREIVIHNSIEQIGNYAFYNCAALSSVVFDDATCEIVGLSAFEGCSALASITIPAGVEIIGARAFANCTALVTVSVDPASNIQTVGMSVFVGCNALKQINIAGDVSSKYYNTVSYDNGNHKMLTDRTGKRVILAPPSYAFDTEDNVFTIPVENGLKNKLTEIGSQAYAYNVSLDGKEVVIPEGITSIGFAAFQSTGITKVTIPSTVTEISPYAFYNCTKLETVIFLCDIAEIPERTFYSCSSLTYVQLPDSVEYIGAYAFTASGIKSLNIGKNVVYLDSAAFSACRSLTSLTFEDNSQLLYVGTQAFRYCSSLTEVSLPDSVMLVDNYAFANCTSLTKAYMSAGLEYMGAYVFTNDLMLAEIEFGYGAKMIGDYAFFTPYGTTGFYYQQYLKTVTVPETVEYIGAYAFAGNTVLTELDLSGVQYIDQGAFYYASALKTVTITDEMEYIGAGAFMGSAIENIDLSVVELFDSQSFYCTNIKAENGKFELTNAKIIATAAFYNCSNMVEVNLPNIEYIYSMAFFAPATYNSVSNVGSIEKVTLGNKLKVLGGAAFFNSQITEINIPASVETIGEPAFAGCFDLERITVEDGSEYFFVDEEQGGLYGYLPNGTYELIAVPNAIVKDTIAEDYKDLDPYVILDGTSRIGSWALGYCSYIHAVTIPASVKTIGAYAFYYMGMFVGTDDESIPTEDLYPVYIFEGLQAPTLEASYDSSSNEMTNMYATFTYKIGYTISYAVIPVNAEGFESLLYNFYFADMTYSEEIIEEDTARLVEWLEKLDLNSLTADDETTVREMNMIYFMMSSGQKTFVSDELVAKLQQAIDRINALTATDGI